MNQLLARLRVAPPDPRWLVVAGVAVVGLVLGVPGVVFLMNSVMAARRGLEELKREHDLD